MLENKQTATQLLQELTNPNTPGGTTAGKFIEYVRCMDLERLRDKGAQFTSIEVHQAINRARQDIANGLYPPSNKLKILFVLDDAMQAKPKQSLGTPSAN